MCSISFEISSLSAHNYVLPVSVLYIGSSLSIEKASVESIMRVKITREPTLSTSVGRLITSASNPSYSLKPTIFRLNTLEMHSNSGLFEASIS